MRAASLERARNIRRSKIAIVVEMCLRYEPKPALVWLGRSGARLALGQEGKRARGGRARAPCICRMQPSRARQPKSNKCARSVKPGAHLRVRFSSCFILHLFFFLSFSGSTAARRLARRQPGRPATFHKQTRTGCMTKWKFYLLHKLEFFESLWKLSKRRK